MIQDVSTLCGSVWLQIKAVQGSRPLRVAGVVLHWSKDIAQHRSCTVGLEIQLLLCQNLSGTLVAGASMLCREVVELVGQLRHQLLKNNPW